MTNFTNILERLQANWPSTLITIAASLLLWYLSGPRMHPGEPPLVPPRIPIIGHLVGLLRHQIAYINHVSANQPFPIFTMPLLNGKLYILTSPQLFQSVMRNPSCDFEPVLAASGGRMHGLGKEAMGIFGSVPPDKKERTFLRDVHRATIEEMGVGTRSLAKMNGNFLSRLAAQFDRIEGEQMEDSFYFWVRDSFTVATTTAVFGEHNPLLVDPSLVNSFWDFDTDLIYLLSGIPPSLIAPKAQKARSKIWSAMESYFRMERESHPSVAPVIKIQAGLARRYGFTVDDTGRLMTGMLFASLGNAAPTIFWMCLHIFVDLDLLEDIRSEVALICNTTYSKEGSGREATIDMTQVSTLCPILYSTYQEVLRLKSNNILARLIAEDVVLSDSESSYLLKKGEMLQIPSNSLHTSPAMWGPDAKSFNARRFLPLTGDNGRPSDATKEQEKLRKKAWLPFGSGTHLCPGRHFAFAEILGMTSMLALGYEISSVDGGPISIPSEPNRSIHFAEGVIKPSVELQNMGVCIRRRKGWEDVAWKFKLAVDK